MTAAGRTLSPVVLAAVFASAVAVTSLDYAFGPGDSSLAARRGIHQGIIDQTTRAPDRYRVLSAVIVEAPVRMLRPFMTFEQAYDRASAVLYFAAMVALLGTHYRFLREWFTQEQALIGVLLLACTLRITIRLHDYAPSSYLEPSFFALSLVAIHRDRRGWLALLLALATLNRETAIFIVAIFAVTRVRSRDTVIAAAGYGALWLAIFAALRYFGGDAERYWTLDRVWRTNMSQPQLAAFHVAALFGAGWIFATLGWRHAPRFVQWSALIVIPYLVTVAIWGIWWEVRLLLPMMPILLALALSYLFHPMTRMAPAVARSV
jgi:hypothetical protein